MSDDAPPTRGPVYVALLWLPLAALGIGAKLYEAGTLGALRGPLSLLAVSGRDLIFFGLGYCFWVAALRAPRGRARRAATLLFHLLVPLMAVFTAVDLAFFVVTGTLGDWYLLKEGLKGFFALRNLYLSQLTVGRVAGLLLPWAASAALWYVDRRRRRGRAASGPTPKALRLGFGAGGALAALGLLGSLATVPGGMRALRRNAVAGMATDIAEDAFAHVGRRALKRLDPSWMAAAIDGPTALVREGSPKTKNVVLILLESTGLEYTGLPGGKYDNTPNLVSLAARGAFVEKAYTVVPHTSKSLVSILCGFYPKLSPEIAEASPQGIPRPCLPRLLREQGYATGFFQTAEQNYELRGDLVDQLGFEHFRGKESIDGTGFDESSYFGWEDDAMLGPIGAWIGQQGQKPFFLTVVTLASHHPYGVPRGFPIKQYAPQKDLNDFLNTIAYTDRFVGKLFADLERTGHLQDTLLVVFGDHGEGLAQHGRREHDAVPYEEGVHVPIVLVGPEVPPKTVVHGLRQLTDIAPTTAHMLGFEGNVPFFGSDLLHDPPHDRLLVFCYYKNYCADAIDADGTKVVYHFNSFPTQLFRLPGDPDERHNLLTGKVDPATRARVDAAVKQITDTMKENNLRYEMQGMVQTSLFVTRTPPPPDGERPVSASFGKYVRLVGYAIDPPEIEPGGRAVITTTYQVLKTPPPGWNLFMHLESPSTSFNADHVPAEGTYPVSQWKPGDFVRDRYVYTTRPAADLDTFTVRMGFWDRGTGRRVPVGASPPLTTTADDRLELGTLEIKKKNVDVSKFVSTTAPADAKADVRFGDSLRLVAGSIDRPITKGGLKTTVTYDFEALQDLGDRYELQVDLEGPARRRLFHKPVYGDYPLGRWLSGQYIRDPEDIVTLTWDPPGKYRVLLSVLDKQTHQALPVSGTGLPIADPTHVVAASYELVR
ncbi:MAG TPA: LTA synthase family protein [Polyangia bacterium]|nr:LTA synthase family protein [Polyangia bacterium]